MVVTANRGDILALNIRTLMTTASPAAVRAGKVNTSMTTQSDIVRPWFIFDKNGFMVSSNVSLDLNDGVTQNGSSTTFPTNWPVAHERRKHHRHLGLEEIFSRILLEPIASHPSTSSRSSSSQLPSPIILPTSVSSSINLTFLTRYFNSRTTSKLRIHFDMKLQRHRQRMRHRFKNSDLCES
jgi:hypothetical protein